MPRKIALSLFGVALCVAICLGAVSDAAAYCVYNHTNVTMNICGETCSHCMKKKVDSGDYGCCPGGDSGCGGHTWITFWVHFGWWSDSSWRWYIPVQVTSHGYVRIYGKCNDYPEQNSSSCYVDTLRAEVYNDDGHKIYDGGVEWLAGVTQKDCKDDEN